MANPIIFQMSAFRRFIRTVPAWAFALITLVIFVDTVYIVYKWQRPYSGTVLQFENNRWIYDHVEPGSTGEKAGIRVGDTLVLIDSFTYEDWARIQRVKAGDTVKLDLLRNGQPMSLQLTYSVRNKQFLWFYIVLLIVMCLYAIASLILLYKKPHDHSVRLFFLYMLCVAICHNAVTIVFPEFLASVTVVAFIFCACILGPILVHFHLLFPRPSKLITRFPRVPVVLYIPALLLFIIFSIFHVLSNYYGTDFYTSQALMWNMVLLYWITLNYFLALITVIYQYREIKDTLARNQLLIIIIGSTFGMLAPIAFAFFYKPLTRVEQYFPFIWESVSGIGTLILVTCILIAILRYRIWDIGIFFRKTILYLGATLIISFTYFILIFLVNVWTSGENNLTRFLALAVSIIVFLILRDRLQRLIDRLFHREPYDSATVVSDFEEKLAGIYRSEELRSWIVKGLDEIFHFSSFVLNLKKEGLTYVPAFVLKADLHKINSEFEITQEFENKLFKSKVFSPGELDQKLPVLESYDGELVVPMLKDDQPYGFFLCGPKLSEKTYSMQDIRVLSLIAKRVIALFHTADLYKKDLDRQLMLERERARISQDMHDDVGASLTRISMMSDLVKNKEEITGENKQWLGQISNTSRGLMEEMNQIIWALNPKNDNLEGLITYVRRFAFEYLEPTSVECIFDLPEELPERALSVEVRRNVYLVAREALHNVVKHSGATTVRINLVIHEKGFSLRIKDDGKGFDPGKLEFSGNGLLNMKKRMDDIGRGFLIRSKPGEGTEIELEVNLK